MTVKDMIKHNTKDIIVNSKIFMEIKSAKLCLTTLYLTINRLNIK